MKKNVALISGINGQTGSYLAEYLLELGYEVHGIVRRSSLIKTDRIDPIFDQVHLHYGDVTDGMNLMRLILEIRPREIYNLAAQSHVAVSFETPEYTANCDGLGTLRFLECIRAIDPTIRFYQASTSELYGSTPPPQNEETVFRPQSPYACAKLYSYWVTRNYRDAYNMFAVNGILFNHESPRRGETFVTRKVTRWVANHWRGVPQQPLQIGNVYAVRDWTHAKDMVRGIHAMMQQDEPDDFVLGSGIGYTVLQLLDTAFAHIGVDFEWVAMEDQTPSYGRDRETGEVLVQVNEKYYRPLEVHGLIADIKKARNTLGWKPRISFEELVKEMVDEDADKIIA